MLNKTCLYGSALWRCPARELTSVSLTALAGRTKMAPSVHSPGPVEELYLSGPMLANPHPLRPKFPGPRKSVKDVRRNRARHCEHSCVRLRECCALSDRGFMSRSIVAFPFAVQYPTCARASAVSQAQSTRVGVIASCSQVHEFEVTGPPLLDAASVLSLSAEPRVHDRSTTPHPSQLSQFEPGVHPPASRSTCPSPRTNHQTRLAPVRPSRSRHPRAHVVTPHADAAVDVRSRAGSGWRTRRLALEWRRR